MGYDPEAALTANLEEMGELADGIVAAEVTQAVRDSTADAGPIKEGDFLGIARDGIKVVRPTLGECVIELLDQIVGDSHEIVTIIQGEGATAAVTRQMTEWLGEHRSAASVETHQGGQPLYPYLFGIE
jgi:dihydroxyacetone kinase-like predicted kinase